MCCKRNAWYLEIIWNNSMRISKEGLGLIKKHESFRNNAYKPVAWEDGYTIGYGNKFYKDGKPVEKGDFISRADAEELLKAIVFQFEYKVFAMLKVPVNQHQFDALVSFAYNIGIYAFGNSTLLKVINRDPKNYPEIERQFKRWNKSSGRVLKGLVKRRNSEFYLYEKER